ncbi:hypothetical protein EYF80_041919 [Liparis tanakae]|uniref:Uncharacterized protein n=1 Tax=Liparis tanakae TaxID=230148 RepID=A0A4Z2G2Y7_9TELE|nr:hypothetical protein EYF80_041919 [Liparis tanakae]
MQRVSVFRNLDERRASIDGVVQTVVCARRVFLSSGLWSILLFISVPKSDIIAERKKDAQTSGGLGAAGDGAARRRGSWRRKRRTRLLSD